MAHAATSAKSLDTCDVLHSMTCKTLQGNLHQKLTITVAAVVVFASGIRKTKFTNLWNKLWSKAQELFLKSFKIKCTISSISSMNEGSDPVPITKFKVKLSSAIKIYSKQ